jgi:hypothetical protein
MNYITTIQGVINHIRKNSAWSENTIRNVIIALGYNPADDRLESLKKLSGDFADFPNTERTAAFPALPTITTQSPFFSTTARTS